MPQPPLREAPATGAPAGDASVKVAPALLCDAAFQLILDLLACPACLQPLIAGGAGLACTGCGRVYPVLDGIPILLVDRATLPQAL